MPDVKPTAQGINTCGNCTFLGERTMAGTICQRFPPVDSSGAFTFPQVNPYVDWCGEHQTS